MRGKNFCKSSSPAPLFQKPLGKTEGIDPSDKEGKRCYFRTSYPYPLSSLNGAKRSEGSEREVVVTTLCTPPEILRSGTALPRG